MFLGYPPIDDVFRLLAMFKAADVPTNSTTTPNYRIYGPTGFLANATGSLSAAETGAITAATQATPIVITSANHGLTTGQRVTITGVLGNTAANGTWTITKIGANSFSLDTSVGNAPYTSGGTWQTTGLYGANITPTEAAGFAQGEHYDILVYATISANVVANHYRFGVV